MTYQDIPIVKYGSADHLKVREQQTAAIGADDVAIAVKYSGINFADIQMRLGYYPDAPSKPFVPGYEVSGVVEEVGGNVEQFEVGDEVMAGTFFGGYSSRVTIPAYQAFAKPKAVTLAQGAAVPVNFITAQMALFEMGRVRKGDRVLIECATGGVGTLAIQMSLAVGAEVVGLTSSPQKKDYIANLGAQPYTRAEFDADTSIGNFDFVLNASGGTSIKQQMKRLRYSGRIVCIGVSSGVKDGKRNPFRIVKAVLQMPKLRVLSLFDSNVGVYGLNALHVMEDPEWVRRLTENFATIDEMNLVPHVDKIFPAEDVAAAHEYLQTKQAVGKILLEWSV